MRTYRFDLLLQLQAKILETERIRNDLSKSKVGFKGESTPAQNIYTPHTARR